MGIANIGTSTSYQAAAAASSTAAPTSTASTPTAATPAAATSTGTVDASTQASVSKDQFLKLLVAQLQHQDPLSPQDPTAFVTQLAQFSALEQSTQTNQQLASLTTTTAAGQRLEMSNLVGHSATAKASSIGIAGAPAAPPALDVHLPSNATNVTVQITDASGNVVRTINMGAQTAGDLNTNWMGVNDKGQALPAGTYGVKVTATGGGGAAGSASIDAYAEVSGVVTAVNFGTNGTQLSIAGSPVSPSDIISVAK